MSISRDDIQPGCLLRSTQGMLELVICVNDPSEEVITFKTFGPGIHT